MMPVFDTSLKTKLVDVSTDLGGKGWVLKDYIIDVYPNLVPGVKTPALWLMGDNSFGQLGDNSVVYKSSPVQTIAGGINWKQVSCNNQSVAAIKTDGTLWCWGGNAYGQLGDNTTVLRSSPVQTIALGSNWTSVSAGYRSVVALKSDGTLWVWGRNDYGQLGDNSTIDKSSPVQTVAGGVNWQQASCHRQMAAVKTDGSLWVWGRNSYGGLGTGNLVHYSSPVQTIASVFGWRSVSALGHTTAALKIDGTLWLWGANNLGQLGDNTVISKSSPIQTIAGGNTWLSVSGTHQNQLISSTTAIKSDGTLWSWGRNSYGQLGDSTTVPRSSPIQTIASGSTWKSLGGRTTTTMIAIKNDGSIWALGSYPGSTSLSSPTQLFSGNLWKSCAGGGTFIAAIADGNY